MLDVSVRLGVLEPVAGLCDDEQLAIMYITHDIASARYLAEETIVMYAGQVVEYSRGTALVGSPRPTLHSTAHCLRAGPVQPALNGAQRRGADLDDLRRRGLSFQPALPSRDGRLPSG